jgi:ribonuclease HI
MSAPHTVGGPARIIEVWTDGGCQGNPGPGGWAFVIRRGGGNTERSGFEPATTNNRMELTAVIRALTEIASGGSGAAGPGSAGPGSDSHGTPANVVVNTDSQYVQKGITEWIHAWSRNGWKTSAKKPVKNAELWSALLELSRGLSIRWQWVLGHAGNELNERCDSLVQEAIASGLKRGE